MYILDFTGFRPFPDNFNFSGVHSKAFWGEQESEVLNFFSMEEAFPGVREKSVSAETSENLPDMFNMHFRVVGVDKDVV